MIATIVLATYINGQYSLQCNFSDDRCTGWEGAQVCVGVVRGSPAETFCWTKFRYRLLKCSFWESLGSPRDCELDAK
jgi:hypothetical protein